MQKVITQEKFSPPGDDVLALIENGMDFLDKARSELETRQYKHSIVSFWTAVEIMLKVPLVHEHWSLVCSGKRFVRSKYLEGDFQSVTYDETCARLEDILEKPLKKETKEIFNEVRRHRNRVVHFHHPQFTDILVKDILAQQANAWFALNRFMREDWASIFGPLHSRKLAMSETQLLKGNTFYSAVRLEKVQPDLIELENAGREIHDCPACHQHAVVETLLDTGHLDLPALYKSHCLVCSSARRKVRMNCPLCGEELLCPDGDMSVTCSKCDADYFRYALIDEDERHSPIDEEYLPAGCTSCLHPTSIAKFGSGYLCSECLEFYKEIMVCECCNHASDSVPQLSHLGGCEFCDGDTRNRDD